MTYPHPAQEDRAKRHHIKKPGLHMKLLMTVSVVFVSQHMKMTCLTRLERTGLAVLALHEECMEDCVLDSTGKERLCPLCVDVFAV